MEAIPTMSCSASFSPCRRYRFELWRRWAPGPYAMFIGLNPSTADETQDDPTIRRCVRFAQAWGYPALCMTNLFAFRATDPRDLKAEPNPIGWGNNATLIRLSAGAGIVIAAWGVHGAHQNRAAEVMELIPELQCLALSKDGHPRHPLYLKADSKPFPLRRKP
jgi:hypothetical protein